MLFCTCKRLHYNVYHLFTVNNIKPSYLGVLIFKSKKTQNVVENPDLTSFNTVYSSHSGLCGRTCREYSIKQFFFSNRLPGFTGDQSNYGCLQVGAQGKNGFTRTFSALFSSGGFEKIKTYLESRKHSGNSLAKRSTNVRRSLVSEDSRKKTRRERK